MKIFDKKIYYIVLGTIVAIPIVWSFFLSAKNLEKEWIKSKVKKESQNQQESKYQEVKPVEGILEKEESDEKVRAEQLQSLQEAMIPRDIEKPFLVAAGGFDTELYISNLEVLLDVHSPDEMLVIEARIEEIHGHLQKIFRDSRDLNEEKRERYFDQSFEDISRDFILNDYGEVADLAQGIFIGTPEGIWKYEIVPEAIRRVNGEIWLEIILQNQYQETFHRLQYRTFHRFSNGITEFRVKLKTSL